MTTLLGIAGSLRKGSTHRALLGVAEELLPAGVGWTTATIGGLPLFDGDLTPPPGVEAFKEAIAAADGVFIASPEYNYGIPGPLKNAIDWASRPAYRSVFAGKPVTMISASPGPIGGARMQAHLKGVLLGMAAHVYPAPEIAIGGIGSKLVDGALVDERTRERLRQHLEAFAAFALAQRARSG